MNRFSLNSHSWCGSAHGLLFLETIGPLEPQIWGKMCPQNQFFSFKPNSMRVFEEKNLKTVFSTPFPIKRQYSFLSSDTQFPQKIIFRGYSEKYCLLRKNCQMKNIQNLNAYKKSYTDFFRQTPLSPKTSMSCHKWCFTTFPKNIAFFEKLVL